MADEIWLVIKLIISVIILSILVLMLFYALGLKRMLKDLVDIEDPYKRTALLMRYEKELDDFRKQKQYKQFIENGDYLSSVYIEILGSRSMPIPEKLIIAGKLVVLSDELLSMVRPVDNPRKYQNIIGRKAMAFNKIGVIKRDPKLQLQSRDIYLDGLSVLDSVEDRKKHRNYLGWIAEQNFNIAYSLEDEKYFLDAIELVKERIRYYSRTREERQLGQLYAELVKTYGDFSKLWNREHYHEEVQRIVDEALLLPGLKQKYPETYSEVLSKAANARYYMSIRKKEMEAYSQLGEKK